MATPKPVLKVLLLNMETLPNLISIGSENINKERKERMKAVPTFPPIFKRFLFLETLKNVFHRKNNFLLYKVQKM
jgi:hypothetical protein